MTETPLPVEPPTPEQIAANMEAGMERARCAAVVRATALAYRDRVAEWQQIISGGQASAPEADADPLVILEWLRQVGIGLLDMSAEQMVLNQGLISLVLEDYPEPEPQ